MNEWAGHGERIWRRACREKEKIGGAKGRGKRRGGRRSRRVKAAEGGGVRRKRRRE
jgi:hypothetical protein